LQLGCFHVPILYRRWSVGALREDPGGAQVAGTDSGGAPASPRNHVGDHGRYESIARVFSGFCAMDGSSARSLISMAGHQPGVAGCA